MFRLYKYPSAEMEDILIIKQYFCRDTKLRLPTKETMSELPISIQDFNDFVDLIQRKVNTTGFEDPRGVMSTSINEIYKCVRDNGFLDQYLALHFEHTDDERKLYPIVLTAHTLMWAPLHKIKSNNERVAKIERFQKRLLRVQLLRKFSDDQNVVEDNKRYGDLDRVLYMMSIGMEYKLDTFNLKRPPLFDDDFKVVDYKNQKREKCECNSILLK